VVKEVGLAIENYRHKNAGKTLDIPLIGVAYWNYTLGKELLENNRNLIPLRSRCSIDAVKMVVFV
jgi:hypothetical protein